MSFIHIIKYSYVYNVYKYALTIDFKFVYLSCLHYINESQITVKLHMIPYWHYTFYILEIIFLYVTFHTSILSGRNIFHQ